MRSHISGISSFSDLVNNLSLRASPLLGLVLLFPLVTFAALLVTSSLSRDAQYQTALASTRISTLLSFALLRVLNFSTGEIQAAFTVTVLPSTLSSLQFGVDGISIYFLLLTNFFIYLSVLSLSPSTPRLLSALLHLLFLQAAVLATFSVLDLLGFFIAFEATLIPIYFLVLLWGSRERRVRASYRISLYTLLGSIFRFFNILYLLSKTGTTDYNILLQLSLTEQDQRFLWITFFRAFAAKVPLFPLHIWLPEAHVEAPTLGSVLLAVLLLKLGTYGLIRFALPLFPEGTAYFAPLVSTFAILGVLYTCLTARRQVDLKKIIAYSSVGHRNLVLLGIRSETSEGLQGAIFQRLSHGVVSGALFFAVGALYERYSVRSLKYFGGLASLYPLLALLRLLFSLANISFPRTSSFVGEFFLFIGLFRQSAVAAAFASVSRVLGAVYTLWTFNRIFFGNLRVLSLTAYKDLTRKEAAILVPLAFLVLFRGIAPHTILDNLLLDVRNLLEHSRRGRRVLFIL